MISQKGLAPILIVLLIAVVGGYFIYQGQVRTSSDIKQSSQPISDLSEKPTKKLVETFYADYLTCLDNHFKNSMGRSSRENCPFNNPLLSDELLLKLNQAEGFDPILCAQDLPDNGFIVEDPFIIANQVSKYQLAKIIVKTNYVGSGPNPIVVNMDNSSSQWKIVDIACSR